MTFALTSFPFAALAQTEQEWRDSLSVLNEKIRQAPRSVDLRLRKAAVNIELGQWSYAVDEYSRILELDAKNLSALYYRAYVHNHERRYELAKQDYEACLTIVPRNFEAQLGLAIVKRNMGQKVEAMDGFNQLIQMFPDSAIAYAARAGLRCAVFLPAGKVALGKLAQAMFHGAEVFSINGNFDEALEAMTQLAREKHLYLLNSINPFRLEGQKTIGYEIVHDLGWESPDRIVLPVGNAGNISAIWKGITEFHNAGFMDDVPMMTGIQAEGACPIANAFRDKTMDMTPVENPETIATAIRIGAPVSAVKALRAIYDSNGLAETVTDEEILDAQKLLARTEGVGVEPASAASIAGLKKLVEQGDIDKGERVVCVVTGHLLKDPNTAIDACVDPVQVDADIDKIKEILLNK